VDLLGAPKSGFKLSLDVEPTQLTLRSRLDPALLYLVVGAAVLLGILGALLGAPDRSVVEAGLFAALFSPIALFLVVSAARLRATCVVDRERDELRLQERGYWGGWEQRYPLEQVGAVLLLTTPPSGPLGAGRSYLLCLAVGDGAYVLAEARYTQSLEPAGRLLARFLGVPLDRNDQVVLSTAQRRRLLVGVLLYVVPVTAAVALLGISIPESGDSWAFSTTLSAIVLSQVGALLTLLYYRRRKPERAAGEPTVGEPAPVPASGSPGTR
jgi:hypothetical protein